MQAFAFLQKLISSNEFVLDSLRCMAPTSSPAILSDYKGVFDTDILWCRGIKKKRFCLFDRNSEPGRHAELLKIEFETEVLEELYQKLAFVLGVLRRVSRDIWVIK